MPRHNDLDVYPLKTEAHGQDRVIIADSQDLSKTKQLELSSVVGLAVGNDSDKIISVGDIVIVGNDLTIPADLQWRISGVIFTKTTITEFLDIPFASPGFKRKDIIVVNNVGGVEIIEGTESDILVIAENVPENSLLLIEVDVTEDTINTSLPVFDGPFVKKVYGQKQLYNGSGENVSIPIMPSGKAYYELTNSDLVSVAGFTNFLLTLEEQEPYEGKDFYIKNSTGTSVILKHNYVLDTEITLLLKGEVDLVIPNNEIISFKMKYGGVEAEEIFRSWGGSSETPNIAQVLAVGDVLTNSSIKVGLESNPLLFVEHLPTGLKLTSLFSGQNVYFNMSRGLPGEIQLLMPGKTAGIYTLATIEDVNTQRNFMVKLNWPSTVVPTNQVRVFGNGGTGHINSITTTLNQGSIYDPSNGRITNNTGVNCVVNINVCLNFGLADWGTTGGSVFITKNNTSSNIISARSVSYISGTNLTLIGNYQDILLPNEYVTINFSQTSGSDKTINLATPTSIESYITASLTKQ